jgi:hypothetical protein
MSATESTSAVSSAPQMTGIRSSENSHRDGQNDPNLIFELDCFKVKETELTRQVFTLLLLCMLKTVLVISELVRQTKS